MAVEDVPNPDPVNETAGADVALNSAGDTEDTIGNAYASRRLLANDVCPRTVTLMDDMTPVPAGRTHCSCLCIVVTLQLDVCIVEEGRDDVAMPSGVRTLSTPPIEAVTDTASDQGPKLSPSTIIVVPPWKALHLL